MAAALMTALSAAEIAVLRSENYPDLRELNQRYLPEIALENGFPAKPEYLDVLRTSWLLDTSSDRPAIETVIGGLGYALGLIVRKRFGFDWYRVQDEGGYVVVMAGLNSSGDQISVTPFAYVQKKGAFPNAEVFVDLFQVLADKMRG